MCDLDGTLAEIVPDPADAAPLPGAARILEALAGRLRTVAVVSGRPLRFLEAHLRAEGPSLVLAGLYGLERSGPGPGGVEPAGAARWRERVAAAVAEANGELPPGVRLEDKGLAFALHYRRAPGEAGAVATLASALGERHGLALKPAKLAVELVPPLPVDKGTVAAELSAGCAVAGVLGDDLGDLAAFDALAARAAAGQLGTAVRIAVAGPEAPGALLERADLVLEGPGAALRFLEDLAGRLDTAGH